MMSFGDCKVGQGDLRNKLVEGNGERNKVNGRR